MTGNVAMPPREATSPGEGTPPRRAATELEEAALAWFEANGRDLAFRRTTDPWAVLVSEVMAQQTQAERAAAAWSVFIDRYPTPAALAAASSADVIRAWRGLGYNRRAVALREAAIAIVERHGGGVPDSLDALQVLPGIGPYTARAVLAIAFGRPVAALDTNVQRVLDRSIGGLPTTPRERQADEFLRLFMVPGMGHCAGGAGTDIHGAARSVESPVPLELLRQK